MVEIPTLKTTIFYRGQLRPFRDHYYATGPDGKRFDNSNKAELLYHLRRNYGKVKLVITDRTRPR